MFGFCLVGCALFKAFRQGIAFYSHRRPDFINNYFMFGQESESTISFEQTISNNYEEKYVIVHIVLLII